MRSIIIKGDEMKEWFRNNKWLIKGTKDTLEQAVMLTIFIALAVIVNLVCVKMEVPPQAGVVALFVGLIWFFNLQLARHKQKLEKKYTNPLED
jgi:Flp pilus assembly protein TadB